MGCVPTSTTISEEKYVTTAGVVKLKDNTVGNISFICPVSNVFGQGQYYLAAWVKASDAAIDTATVQLRARNMENGHTRTILTVGTPSSPGQTAFRELVSVVETLDFSDPFETYWAQITLKKRNRTDETVSVLAVEIRQP